MNALLENNIITEMACGTNFAYVLNDNGAFLSTEYKVLQSQTNDHFVRCMKMLYNGRVQLYYLTGQCKPLSELVPGLDAESFMVICANLFADIIDVKSNGFLSCQNIDISFSCIYVDTATYKVQLVYLPVAQRVFDDAASFENELRTSLVKLLQEHPALETPKTKAFVASLSNGSHTIEDIYVSIKIGKAPEFCAAGSEAAPGPIRLVALDAPQRLEIPVTKNGFTIGKKAELVDFVVDFNKAISRSHCKITQEEGRYVITDLHSANGTFVNRVRLQPEMPHPIQPGDIVRLANIDFKVTAG